MGVLSPAPIKWPTTLGTSNSKRAPSLASTGTRPHAKNTCSHRIKYFFNSGGKTNSLAGARWVERLSKVYSMMQHSLHNSLFHKYIQTYNCLGIAFCLSFFPWERDLQLAQVSLRLTRQPELTLNFCSPSLPFSPTPGILNVYYHSKPGGHFLWEFMMSLLQGCSFKL